MKKTILLSALFVLFSSISAQSPQAFNYQAVIRYNAGELLANEAISLTGKIIQDSVTGTIVYSEDHNVTTKDNGLVNLAIGTGIRSDDFTAIEWPSRDHFIQTEIDGTVMGTRQLLSVPYSISASTISG